MKIKTAVALLALCISSVFAMHAGAATIDSAFDNAENSYTIQLTEDSDISSVIKIENGKDVTLDLNGYTLTPAAKAGFYVSSATFTVIDSSDMKGGSIYFANAPYSYSSITGVISNAGGYVKWILADNNSTLRVKDSALKIAYTGTSGWETFIDIDGNSRFVLENSSVESISGGGPFTMINTRTSDIDIISSKISASENNLFAISISGGDFTMEGDSSIINEAGTVPYCYGIISDANSNIRIESGSISASSNTVSDSNTEISGGTISGDIEYSGVLKISNNAIINADIMSIDTSSLEITGGRISGKIIVDDEEDKVSISGGTFAIEPKSEYLAPGLEMAKDENGNYVIGGSNSKITTSAASAAVGTDDSVATGFVTTISGVELSKISWIVTSNDVSKQTAEYDINGVSSEGDVKIGLIISGLNDASAAAKATVNGSINE